MHRCLDYDLHPICEPGEGLSYCEFGAAKAGGLTFVINPFEMRIDVYLGSGWYRADDDWGWGGVTTLGLGHEYYGKIRRTRFERVPILIIINK